MLLLPATYRSYLIRQSCRSHNRDLTLPVCVCWVCVESLTAGEYNIVWQHPYLVCPLRGITSLTLRHFSVLWLPLSPRTPHLFSSAGAVQQTLYQVPTSNRPFCSPVDPKAVAGIYEIEPDANPLHPRHQSHVLQQLHNDDPLHSSVRRGSVPARPLSATVHKYSRVPKTPPPKTRPPECPPTDSSFSSHKMRSYSTDELNISPLQGSASPLAFNPPLKQQNRKSEALCIILVYMRHIVSHHINSLMCQPLPFHFLLHNHNALQDCAIPSKIVQ